jgi:hypothetical protein
MRLLVAGRGRYYRSTTCRSFSSSQTDLARLLEVGEVVEVGLMAAITRGVAIATHRVFRGVRGGSDNVTVGVGSTGY